MATYPQFLTYNPCTVTINGTYTITNIQTKGLPSDECRAHIESISIKSAATNADNPDDWGASGTVTVVDYKNAVFNALRGKLVQYLGSNPKDNNFLSTLTIHIDCFTGSRDWFGWITGWSYEFVGTTPSLQLTWTAIPPTGVVNTGNIGNNGEYTKPADLLSDIQKAHPVVSGDVPVVDISGKDLTSKLEFKSEKVNYDTSSMPACSSPLVSGYDFVTQSCTVDGKPLSHGEIVPDENGNVKYVVQYAEVENNTESTPAGKVVSGLIFVQNGSYTYYKAREDGKCVIPMTSFNFSTDMTKMVLQSRILNTPNGNIVQNASNGESHQEVTGSNSQAGQTTQAATGASGVVVTFECYNVLTFSMNNINEQIQYEVYDEFGKEHPVTGSGTVTEVSYSLQGGVVKANVTAAEYYNKAETTSSGSSNVPSSGSISTNSVAANVIRNISGLSSVRVTDLTDAIANSDEEGWLRCEDNMSLPLYLDRTKQSVQSGDYIAYVTEFFDRGYGDLSGSDRLLDWDYISNLISSHNIALLTLLLAVANYGIKDVPSDIEDYALKFNQYKGKKPFFASGIGKKPFDYETGGLGIPHWDSGNYGEIYSTVGFSPDVKNDQNFKSLLTVIKNPPTIANPDSVKQGKAAKYYTGKVIDWKEGTYCGQSRVFPVTNGEKCYWTKFDEGLKQNKIWRDWANNILHFKNESGMIYQAYLFNLWIKKFWDPTINKLSSVSSEQGHSIGLQDAVRISRMGNSASGLISKSSGKNVSDQLDDYLEHYKNSIDHAVRQWIYCRRTASLLEQCSSMLA